MRQNLEFNYICTASK